LTYYFCVEKALLLSVEENIASNTAEGLDSNPNLREHHLMPSDTNTQKDGAKAPSSQAQVPFSQGQVTNRRGTKQRDDTTGTYPLHKIDMTDVFF
jgi:hypothetical protein